MRMVEQEQGCRDKQQEQQRAARTTRMKGLEQRQRGGFQARPGGARQAVTRRARTPCQRLCSVA